MRKLKKPQLWNAIKNFELDEKDIEFTFSQRLARDNNWSIDFSLDVIQEYKKFLYLCCVSEQQITPSDAVDQAWHLHLTYTKSYWIDLCRDTLQKEIHHNPTKGGSKENNKYANCYEYTFQIYKQEFNTDPPRHIWLDNKKRFSDINYKRINLGKYWLIRKPGSIMTRTFVLGLSAMIVSMLFIRSNPLNPVLVFLMIVLTILLIRNLFGNNNSGGGSGCSHLCGHDHSGCSSDGCSSGCSGCGD